MRRLLALLFTLVVLILKADQPNGPATRDPAGRPSRPAPKLCSRLTTTDCPGETSEFIRPREQLMTEQPTEKILQNGFTKNRSLLFYKYEFPGLLDELLKLDENGHWLDAGAGDVIAMRVLLGLLAEPVPTEPEDIHSMSFYEAHLRMRSGLLTELSRFEKRPRGTAVSFMIADNFARTALDGRFRALEGRFIEEIPNSEIGKADVITDLCGCFVYSSDPDFILAKYLSLLKDGGTLYLKVGTSELDHTFLSDSRVGDKTLRDWLSQVKGITVTVHSGSGVFLKIKRVPGQAFRVPKLRYQAEINLSSLQHIYRKPGTFRPKQFAPEEGYWQQ